MIDDVMRAHFFDPRSRLGTGCGSDHVQRCQTTGQLDQDGAHAACTVNCSGSRLKTGVLAFDAAFGSN